MSYTVTEEAARTIQEEYDVLMACADGMFHNIGSSGDGVDRVACGLQNQLIRVEKAIKTALVLKKIKPTGK